MLRLPLVGGLQRCSRISLFCLHPHRTPQGFLIIIIIIIINITITVNIIIILSPQGGDESQFWKSLSMATNVCRWTGGRCAARWTSPGWSLVVVSCHWCSLVAILVVIGASYWSSVCGTMDLTRWIFLIINCGLGLSSVVSRCYWLSFGWSLVVIGVHWC